MALQHSSVGSPYFGIELNNNSYYAKVGTFPLSYTVTPSFISCFTTFRCKVLVITRAGLTTMRIKSGFMSIHIERSRGELAGFNAL